MRKLKIIVSLMLGIFLALSSLIAYKGLYKFCYEMTFLSNMLTGILLIVSGVMYGKNKKIVQWIYLDSTVVLLIVYVITAAFRVFFNMKGAMYLLHGVNPLLMLIYYLIFTDQTDTKSKYIWTCTVFPICYLVLAVIINSLTGNAIYFFLDYKTNGIKLMIQFIIAIFIGVITVSYGLLLINKKIQNSLKGNEN